MFIKKEGIRTVKDLLKSNINVSMEEFFNTNEFPYVKNLKEAKEYIINYLKTTKNPKVSIVGDYDSDGINSVAILYWMFAALKITPYIRIPKRFSEGYGLNPGIIDEIDEGLLITIDNGIVAFDAIKKAKEKGLSVIIIDHHLGKIEDGKKVYPPADVIVDPEADDESEFKYYCGASLAWRLACEMLPGINLNSLKVLAGIATITDVMPLVGANRILVKDSLKYINKGENVPGLNALLSYVNKTDHLSEEDYGFLIGPIFNAAERMRDNGAKDVVDLLTCKANDKRLKELPKILEDTNEKRKEIVNKTMSEIIYIGEKPVVIYKSGISEGIIGLIAGRFEEIWECPVIVFTDSSTEGVLKGSGRCPAQCGINLKETLDKISGDIIQYGGHAGAAGLTIEANKLKKFERDFEKACGVIPDPPEDIYYDLDLNINKIPETYNILKQLTPFGEGNPKPLLHIVIKPDGSFKKIGDYSQHFLIRDSRVTLFGFNLERKYEELKFPRVIDAVGYLQESWFNNRLSYNFNIVDMQKCPKKF